jgi:zinc transport system substrate-binding protein
MTVIMKNPRAFLTACFMAVFLLIPVAGANAAAEGSMELGATIFPAADIARRIAGPGSRIIQILPAGASPHTFDLAPGKVLELQDARLIFKIGGVDDWIDGIAESLPRARMVVLHDGVSLKPFHDDGHHHAGAEKSRQQDFDPHYWLSAENGAVMARNWPACMRRSSGNCPH